MTKQERLDKQIDRFILRQNSAFSLEDIAHDSEIIQTGGRKGVSKEAILDSLNAGSQVFSPDSRTFIPRHQYFKGARFLIAPTDEEIGLGILIPGHRFLPFCDPLRYPWECSLFLPDCAPGVRVPRKVIAMEFRALQIYYVLLGIEHIGELLCGDQPLNIETLESGEAFEQTYVQLTVFDLGALYREWGFKRGDALLCETDSWAEGAYTIRRVSAEQRQDLMASSGKWAAALEAGFQHVFEARGFIEELDEQIAYAYYYAGPAVLKAPPMHLGGFIETSSKVHIVSMGFETKLWHEQDLKFSRYLKDIGIEQSDWGAAAGGLETLLEELNAPCSTMEMKAFIRDEFFQHKGVITPDKFDRYTEAVVPRMFGERRAKEVSEKQWSAVKALFRKLWRQTGASYNYFQDQLAGKVRQGLLAMLEGYFEWMEGLTLRFMISADSPAQHTAGLGRYMAGFTSYFEQLEAVGPNNEQDIKKLYSILPQINETIEMMKQIAEEQLNTGMSPVSRKPQLYLVRPDNDKPKHIFVFRIMLKDSRPLIWRAVQVPGSFTLGELHYVIQDTMDWTDSRMHCFEINGVCYGSGADNTFSSVIEDEQAHVLDSLNLNEKQCFTYIYDFDDQWVHHILVSKIMPSSDFSKTDWRYPVCLSGRCAGPPEQCGGLPGYERLLEAFKAPNEKKSRELLACYPNFNPDFFDVDLINAILYSDVDGDE
jgi:hypothetical protein